MNLADKLNKFSDTLDADSKSTLKLILGMAAGNLFPTLNEDKVTNNEIKKEAAKTICRSVSHLAESGILWQGRPNFLTDDLLKKLQQESFEKQSSSKPYDRHLISQGGEIANQLAFSEDLINLIKKTTKYIINPTGIASYLYYTKKGLGICPHVDTDIFEINFLIMLNHQYITNPSHFQYYSRDGEKKKILLLPGECILFNAGGTIHAREDIGDNEFVNILTIGFQY